MKKLVMILGILMNTSMLVHPGSVGQDIKIPIPSDAQLRWQNYERIMFVHFSANTWQTHRGLRNEWDDLSTPLSRINPTELNTDQWCEVAKSWGAKMILFVAKHVGGFCSWQTNTTEYGIKNTPWKNGKGDILQELSVSCKKYGLDLGIYVYPGDPHWGADVGSGGTTKDPSRQAEFNKVYRQQMTEVLSRYGKIREVWFDGSCNIPVDDILHKYAPDAVVLQGPMASLRWVGNEDGYAPYTNWYTLSSKDLKTGVSTAIQSDAFGDTYAPVEIDVPLLKNKGHKWFWAPNTDNLILTTEQLMNMYYKSVGRGAVLLINSTPDTTGLIPQSHVKAYKAFGDEIKRRFDNPISKTRGEGNALEIAFTKPTELNHVILQEDLSKGQRVLAYSIEGTNEKGVPTVLYNGTSVGHKRICYFSPISLRKIGVSFTNVKAKPIITNFSVFNIKGVSMEPEKRRDLGGFYDGIARKNGNNPKDEPPVEIGNWDNNSINAVWKERDFDLTKYITKIGQYEVTFAAQDNSQESGLEFKDWEIEMYGGKAKSAIELLKGTTTFRITRSQQTLDQFPTILRLKVKSKLPTTSGKIIVQRLTY